MGGWIRVGSERVRVLSWGRRACSDGKSEAELREPRVTWPRAEGEGDDVTRVKGQSVVGKR